MLKPRNVSSQNANSTKNLTPASPTGQRYTQWFNHGWDIIQKAPDKTWKTQSEYPLSPRAIWDKHQDPKTIIGLRFGQTTRISILDIDRGSPYHPANDREKYQDLLGALEEIGLCRPIIIQSSDSEGLHILYPFREEMPTFKTACLVQNTLQQAGFPSKKGELEIFPNPKRYGKEGKKTLYNGIRLPLQPESGSYILDADLNISSEKVEDLLDQMDWAAAGQDIETFRSKLKTAYQDYKAQRNWQREPLSQQAREWEEDLKKTIEQGWTGHHQTNDLLIKIVTHCIVFRQLSEQKLREQAKKIAINAPGYQEYCRHQHEIEKRIEEICHHTEKNEYYLPYCNYPNRSRNFEQTYKSQKQGEKRGITAKEEARERLYQTVTQLEEEGKLPQQVAERRQAIQKAAKEKFNKAFSISTLNRKENLVLWHPKHRSQESNCPQEWQKNLSDPPEEAETLAVSTVVLDNSENTPPEEAETLAVSTVVLDNPIYEVLESSAPHKKNQNSTTNSPDSRVLADPPSKRVSVQGLTQEVNSSDYWLQKRQIDANKQYFVNLGLSIPESILRYEAELEASFSSQSGFSPLGQCLDIGMVTAQPQSSLLDKLPTEIPQPIPEVVPACPSVPEEESQTSPQEVSPQKVTKKILLQRCEDYGVTVNSTVRKLVVSNSVEVVVDALETLRQHKRNGRVNNPAGFLVKAIQERWRPADVPTQTVATSSPSPHQQEFLDWYGRAISAGVVEDLPVRYLSVCNREPMVRVKRPLGNAPYTAMRWTEARDEFGNFLT
jgi:hypothetical protein